MAIVIKTPRQVAQEFLDNLKALRPEINTDQTDSDWWIRSRVIGGVIGGVYADLSRVSNDAFPQSARREAVDRHLQVYFGSGLRPAQPAVGNVGVTGNASGITVNVNTQFIHPATSQTYISTETVILQSVTGSIPVQSVTAGADQNLNTGTTLTISAPPGGLNSASVILSPGLTDGADVETTEAGAARVLAQIRNPSRGGTETDYANWAVASDVRVIGAVVNRHVYGLGTVQVIISAGTNAIDDAVDNDLPIVVQPSEELKEIVHDYIDAINPVCDAVYIDGPTELAIDVTCKVAFVAGNKDTLVENTTITQGHLVVREIQRALYKTPIGGRVINGVAALRAADIEEQIDYNLSSAPYAVGLKYQIVGDRQVTISGGNPNLTLGVTQAAVPGTITIEDL